MRVSSILLTSSLAVFAIGAPVQTTSTIENPAPVMVRNADPEAISPVLENLKREMERLESIVQRSIPESQPIDEPQDEDSEETFEKRGTRFGLVSPSKSWEKRGTRFGLVSPSKSWEKRGTRFGLVSPSKSWEKRGTRFGLVSPSKSWEKREPYESDVDEELQE